MVAENVIVNPLQEIMPGAKCVRCFDTCIWLTPRNRVETCPVIQLGQAHNGFGDESILFSGAARRLQRMGIWITPMAFELGRILTHYDTYLPCEQSELLDCFFADTNLNDDEKRQKLFALICELEYVWKLKICYRAIHPSGYWIGGMHS